MDLDFDYSYPSTAAASSSPAAAYTQLLRAAALSRGGGRRAPAIAGGGSILSRLAGKLVSVILTCIFAIVGSFVGAITGALIGLATESGLLCGAGIGAISGAVFSVEAVESSIAIWHSHGSGIWSLIFVLDIILSLLSGTIVQEKVGPALQSAVQSQMSAIDGPFREQLDIFEIETKTGMPSDSIRKLPKVKITDGSNVDASGEKICCSVCLQDFQVGETVRMLPECQHMFHLPCIDGWLADHGSCPLCRRGL